MKKTITFLVCLLLASLGWVLAQQAKPITSVPAVAPLRGSGMKHLYLRNGKTHLVLQPTRTGTRVYRQIGNRLVSMY